MTAAVESVDCAFSPGTDSARRQPGRDVARGPRALRPEHVALGVIDGEAGDRQDFDLALDLLAAADDVARDGRGEAGHRQVPRVAPLDVHRRRDPGDVDARPAAAAEEGHPQREQLDLKRSGEMRSGHTGLRLRARTSFNDTGGRLRSASLTAIPGYPSHFRRQMPAVRVDGPQSNPPPWSNPQNPVPRRLRALTCV